MFKVIMGYKAKKITSAIACFLLVSTGSTSALAQQFDDAASVQFGGFEVIPTVDIGVKFDDNVSQLASDEISSWSRIVSPQVSMISSLGASQVDFGYRIKNEDFFSSKEDNYTDHFLTAGADVELSARHRVNARLDFEDGHDARGSGFSIGNGDLINEPDQYKQTQLDFLYSYGAFNSQGRIDVNFNVRTLDYDVSTPEYLVRDRRISRIGGTYYHRIGATTDLTFDIIRETVSYKTPAVSTNPLDSRNMSYLVGLSWEATANTSGFAKVGYQEKRFDSALRDDFDGFDWAAGVRWEPVEYASVEIRTSADTNETNGEGNFIRGRTHTAVWRHEWLDRVRSRAAVVWNNNRYEGQLIDGLSIRSDDNLGFRASVYYQFRRWINFEVGYRFDERDSNRNEIDFDRNQFIFNALVTL
ncbi:outer membrane beta-barrel protein [Glaciecola petra]|uniref:Outer membrane beta-barrel protein n=1 Tax=Glaciecola petra TaxID=3075602 RepID=A0ABU2ZUM5_9ALTE|nr:outer membrane beta-barrel protein [Aestuariibacter sp. P117]MDT0595961.1 outer membrane beta-barrel protein [Aestuariibacter sp. P117]